MLYLWISSFIWAFSFSLIGHFVVGQCDSYFAILIRMLIAFLIFLPFLEWKINKGLKIKFAIIGALQIGLMYVLYYNSFRFLSVSEVALSTIFTPFWIAFIYSILKRRFRLRLFAGIFVCIFGAFIIRQASISNDFWLGFALIQGANLLFGTAQIAYKILCQKEHINKHRGLFGYFFLGALIFSFFSFLFFGDFDAMPRKSSTWVSLLYLGFISSGLGYFCWNKGASLVSAGRLAVMNNAVIPLAILAEFVVFKADIADLPSFILGSIVMFSSLLFFVKNSA